MLPSVQRFEGTNRSGTGSIVPCRADITCQRPSIRDSTCDCSHRDYQPTRMLDAWGMVLCRTCTPAVMDSNMVQMLILGLLVRAVGSAMPCSDSAQSSKDAV